MRDLSTSCGYSTVPPVPEYISPKGGYDDTFVNSDIKSGQKGNYPYQIFNPHYARTAHAHFDNIPWLREAFVRPVFMNELDAQEAGLKEGDIVRVYNDTGSIVRPLCATKRMVRGVIGVTHGGWLEVDEATGYDIGGSANTLCASHAAGLRTDAYNSGVAAVELYNGEFIADAYRLNGVPACQE